MKVLHSKEEIIELLEELIKDMENGDYSRLAEVKGSVEELKRNVETMLGRGEGEGEKEENEHSFSRDNKWMTQNQNERQSFDKNDLHLPLNT